MRADPDYKPLLSEYRHELACARPRIAALPPEYRDVLDAYVTKCEVAVALVEQWVDHATTTSAPAVSSTSC